MADDLTARLRDNAARAHATARLDPDMGTMHEAEAVEWEAAADRIDALTAERDAARAEVDRLLAWKAEAMAVLAEWDKVWDAARRPGPLGASKATSTAARVAAVETECDLLREVGLRVRSAFVEGHISAIAFTDGPAALLALSRAVLADTEEAKSDG